MQMHADALDFSTLSSALNIESWGAKLFDAVVDQMTADSGKLAISSQMNMHMQDSAVSGTGSIVDMTM